ncbi:four helix bundle protein [Portibacter lacus]|uniref:Four helix bundle protein n=1 Tax=Portibacter lacus TaxID=1099794 RepID=A0AA37WEL2_9BACT|nr:four helix bundle protein [Portibacter lacus]GLR18881.1 four helix bundle protein [Portibacter lacus]
MGRSYKDLIVWQKAHIFTLEIYKISSTFPDNEKYGITSQVRRAVVSIELNIVEGKSRMSDKEFRHFLHISRGSNQEVHCILEICKDLNYITNDKYEVLIKLCDEINKMLNGFIKKISQ